MCGNVTSRRCPREPSWSGRLSREESSSLLAACPPCQGFSTLRTLNGSRRIEDHRNGLLRDVTRFVRVLKPMTVLAENVPGLARADVFDRFIDDLDALGYKRRHEVVDVSQYGVPQRRRRLLIVASRLGQPPVGERSPQRVTVRKALVGLPAVGSDGDVLHDAPERRTERIAAMIRLVPLDGGSRHRPRGRAPAGLPCPD